MTNFLDEIYKHQCNLTDIENIIKKYPHEINAKDSNGETVLMHACKSCFNNNTHIIKLLIDAGCNVNIRNVNGETCLMLAVKRSDLKIVSLLIDAGANVNVKTSTGTTSLMLTSSNLIAKLLIDNGANLEIKNNGGQTALMRACRLANTQLIQALVDASANLDAVDNNGTTALMFCAKYAGTKNGPTCLKILIDSGADVNIQDRYGQTALMIASMLSNKTSNISAVKMMIDAGSKVNLQDRSGCTALMLASKTVESDSTLETVKRLIDAGSDINIQNKRGYTALMYACEETLEPKTVTLLIENGADIKIKNDLGQTALMIASCYYEPTHIDRLLAKGSNINDTDKKGNTALTYAVLYCNTTSSTQCIETLVDAGADYAIKCCYKNIVCDNIFCFASALYKTYHCNECLTTLTYSFGTKYPIKYRYFANLSLFAMCQNKHLTVEDKITFVKFLNMSKNIGKMKLACNESSYNVLNLDIEDELNISKFTKISKNINEMKSTGKIICGGNLTSNNKSDVSNFLKVSKSINSVNSAYDLYIKNGYTFLEKFHLLQLKGVIVTSANPSNTYIILLVKSFMKLCKKYDNNKNDISTVDTCEFQSLKSQIVNFIRSDIEKYPAKINKQNSKGYTPLMYICSQNFTNLILRTECERIIKYLVDNGANVNFKNKEGDSVLLMAVSNQMYDLIDLLIHLGANIRIKNAKGETALMIECKSNKCKYENIKKLVDAGSNVNDKNNEGSTALHIACSSRKYYSSKTIKLLIESGAKINEKDNNGRTALMISYVNTYTTILIESGANIDEVDNNGNTALMILCLEGPDYDFIHQLIDAGANVKIKNSNGKTAFDFVRDAEILTLLEISTLSNLNIQDENGNNPLMKLCSKDYSIWLHDETFNYIIKKDTDVNIQNSDGNTALMLLCKNKNISITHFEILLDKSNLNLQNLDGDTALTFILNHNIQLCDLEPTCKFPESEKYRLIKKYLNVDVLCGEIIKICRKNRWRDFIRLQMYIDRCLILKTLMNVIQCNSVDLQKMLSQSILSIIKQQLLFDACENITVKNKYLIKVILKLGISVNCTNSDGDSCLLIACRNNDLETVKQLIDYGADLNYYNNDTVLLMACKTYNFELIKLLISAGVDVNGTDRFGNTPLMHIIMNSRNTVDTIKAATILINSKCDLNSKNIYGNTALMIACEMCDFNMIKFLLDERADCTVVNEITGKSAILILLQHIYFDGYVNHSEQDVQTVVDLISRSDNVMHVPDYSGITPFDSYMRQQFTFADHLFC